MKVGKNYMSFCYPKLAMSDTFYLFFATCHPVICYFLYDTHWYLSLDTCFIIFDIWHLQKNWFLIPSTEDDLRRKTSFDRRQSLQKKIFGGRRPLAEDDLWRKTTFDGRRPSIGCIVFYLKKMFMNPHLDSHSITDPQTGNSISCLNRK